MDVLSDVVAAIRTGHPRSAVVRQHAPWGRRYPAVPGVGFHVVLEGSCWLLPAEGAPIALNAGDVVFFPHPVDIGLADDPITPLAECDQAAYAAAPDAPAPAVVTADDGGSGRTTVTLCGAYQLDRARSHPLLDELPAIVHLPARLGRHPSLRGAIELLGAEVAGSHLGSDTTVPALLDVLLLCVLREWFEQHPGHGAATGWAAALNDPEIARALSAIHRAPARPWTVAELGARVGLSRTAFARRFTTLVGRPPLGYLTWWRMATAARLLRDSGAPLHAVAAKVGYTSPYAFATAFKREYGIAPGRFREQGRGGSAALPLPAGERTAV